MTLGSPIAFDLFGRDWRSMTDLVLAGKTESKKTKFFPWVNFWDPTDPIVSGSLAGLPSDAKQFTRKFRERTYDLGWDVRSRATITGLGHLEAHTAYWKDTFVGISLRSMMAKYGECD
jgi:hypothetical protein